MRSKGIISITQLEERDLIRIPLRAFKGAATQNSERIWALVLPAYSDDGKINEGDDLNLCPVLTRADAEKHFPNNPLIQISDNQGAGLPNNQDYVIVEQPNRISSKRHILDVGTQDTVHHAGGFANDHPDWLLIDKLFDNQPARQQSMPGGLARTNWDNFSGTTNIRGGLGRGQEMEISAPQVNRGSRGPRKAKNQAPVAKFDLTKDEFIRIFNPSDGLKHVFNQVAQQLEKPELLLSEVEKYISENQSAVTQILAQLIAPSAAREPSIEEILRGNLIEETDQKVRGEGKKGLAVKRIKGFLEKFTEDKKSGQEGPYTEISTISDFLTAHKKFNSDNNTDQPLADWLFRFRGVGIANYKQLAEDIVYLQSTLPKTATPEAPATTPEAVLDEVKNLRRTFFDEALALDYQRPHKDLSLDDLKRKYGTEVDGQIKYIHKKMFLVP